MNDAEIRITPTYMGNTAVRRLVDEWTEGSPPHTWGILQPFTLLFTSYRITPTYMGNTDATVVDDIGERDHPHIHGEYLATKAKSLRTGGSPPHTWGILGR